MLIVSSGKPVEQPNSIGQMFLFATVVAVVIAQGLIEGGVGFFRIISVLGTEILKMFGRNRVLLQVI